MQFLRVYSSLKIVKYLHVFKYIMYIIHKYDNIIYYNDNTLYVCDAYFFKL